tara:strand:+ start:23427 stop:23612 length:186 start_codon:yes stop_codon:yes gene_type:complete
MTMLYVLIPISILLVLVAMLCFNWAVKSQQYDDLDSPASQIIFDDVDAKDSRHKAGEEIER